MLQSTGMTWGLCKTLFWLGQVPVDNTATTPKEAAFIFAGPQFLMALVAGVVLAFAIQLLITNLGVAYLLGNTSDSKSHDDDADSLGTSIRKIGTALGLATLISVTVALSIACFLAVKLSLNNSDRFLGAIIGLVIWGTYFSLLVWVGSAKVGSLIGSVVNAASSGLQTIFGTATAALGAKAVNDQVVATAEAAAVAVRRELGSAIDPTSIRETLEDYFDRLRPAELDLKSIRGEFEKLLNDPQLKAIAPENLRDIDRSKFVELVSSRTDLSKRDVKRIVDQLENVWKQVVDQQAPQAKNGMGELLDYLKSASPDKLTNELGGKLDQLIGEMRSNKQPGENQDQQTPGMMDRLITTLSPVLGVVMGRTDISDLDLEKILGQLQTAKAKVNEVSDKIAGEVSGTPALPYSTIRADVDNYLLNTYSWQMKPEVLAQEFRDVIYDPQADPKKVRQQIEQLKRSDFVDLLQQRGIFTQAKINEIADRLEAVRQDVLATVRQAEEEEKISTLRKSVENYLRYTPVEQLSQEAIDRDFPAWLEDPDADYETVRRRLAVFDRDTLLQMLLARTDINAAQAEPIVTNLISTRDRVLTDAQSQEEQAKSQAEALWLKVESYLRNTGKDELNPEGIKRDLSLFLDDPRIGLSLVRARASRFDRDTLVQLLSSRQDISQDQANQIVDQVQSRWNSVMHAPQAVADKAKELTGTAKDQYDKTTNTIAEYLRNTGKDELNPEGIKRDLQKLLDDPKGGALALRDRVSNIDRDTLVKLLSQRQDLSEEQVNQIIDQVQENLRSIVRAPRRLAARTQAKVQDFQSTLQEYLRNTGKDELNPEGIKRDLQLLLHDPRTGVESFADRLSKVDRETVVSLLSQRPDISEEEANRIVDQVLAVREQFVEQVRDIQRRIQSVIDGVFAKIRNYLNSLDRPELNYDGIKHDVRTLFDDPQAGFDALKDRLGHFNRDTVVALLSSREDISEADANRIVDQIERTRTSVLQRAERLQQEAQRRVEDVKRQAQRQAEETRKAAATAAWWLFGTAATSAIASAIAGALAVRGG
ncbi:MFS transporter [Microcoleus sp. FACHB-831]|uniref:MFS transporter n=1 Tax=Microcoleus sp. FACHB-831 TaxID=2692827 RepID=UPI00168777AF|nr:MFS transporter [Microcoleus sp. FACHB-831]MBD1920922.1 MFS transporter [Microcoleus sp. FACHB-831]